MTWNEQSVLGTILRILSVSIKHKMDHWSSTSRQLTGIGNAVAHVACIIDFVVLGSNLSAATAGKLLHKWGHRKLEPEVDLGGRIWTWQKYSPALIWWLTASSRLSWDLQSKEKLSTLTTGWLNGWYQIDRKVGLTIMIFGHFLDILYW